MSAREQIFASIRSALGVTGREASRRKEVADRLADHPNGVVPARGTLPPHERLALFVGMVEAVSGTVERLGGLHEVPGAVAAYLRANGLPLAIRRGEDAVLAALPWGEAGDLEVSVGASRGEHLAAVSRAIAGVAETGTLVLVSGRDNPTTLNFLPDHHLVVLAADTIVGDYETVLRRLVEERGPDGLPRVVNLVTGPSRSADIEQQLLLGAHGPRRLHVLLVGEPA